VNAATRVTRSTSKLRRNLASPLQTKEGSVKGDRTGPLVSIIINNYNYARFLPAAIESALGQSYSHKEIVIVDDGSTDESQEIILRQEYRVVPILKRNGGQASALNVGVAQSRGKIICFLDSDDCWYPDKVARIVEIIEREGGDSRPLLVHHLLEILDQSTGEMTGQYMGNRHKSPYNLYDLARRYRFIPYIAGPTSGISINRALANLLFPLPEHRASISADDFVVLGASLVGELHSLNAVLGSYRVHDRNAWFRSDRRKSPEFVETLDDYLNRKLVSNDLSPIISFYDSMYCWQQLANEKRWLAMIGSMIKLLIVQRDTLTLKFVYETMKLIFNSTPLRRYSIFRRFIEITRPLRIRFLGW
jgi:glycosyltransferase involved in cell wall biosynthesis